MAAKLRQLVISPDDAVEAFQRLRAAFEDRIGMPIHVNIGDSETDPDYWSVDTPASLDPSVISEGERRGHGAVVRREIIGNANGGFAERIHYADGFVVVEPRASFELPANARGGWSISEEELETNYDRIDPPPTSGITLNIQPPALRDRMTEISNRIAADMEARLLRGDRPSIFPPPNPNTAGRYEISRNLEQRVRSMEIEQVITYSDGTEERRPFMRRDQRGNLQSIAPPIPSGLVPIEDIERSNRPDTGSPTGRRRESPWSRALRHARNYSMGFERMTRSIPGAPIDWQAQSREADLSLDRLRERLRDYTISRPQVNIDFAALEARVLGVDFGREETPQQEAITRTVKAVAFSRDDGFVRAGRRRIRLKK